MRTKNLLNFALFITIAVLLSGCGKKDAKLESENADLKARIQKLEQQLKASSTRPESPAQPAASPDLQSQLAEALKRAEAAESDLASLRSLGEAQKVKIDGLMRDLVIAQQARDKAEKSLLLYQDKTAVAIKEFKTLRSAMGVTNTLGGTNVLSVTNLLRGTNAMIEGYHQKYLAMQKAVTNAIGVLPESRVRREILIVLATFARVNDTWETAGQQMQEQTKAAQADYDKFIFAEGLGPNDYLIKMGKEKILAPVEKENAEMASQRDQQMVSSEKDIDLAIKNLQALVNAPKA
jgi:hypothetical protein